MSIPATITIHPGQLEGVVKAPASKSSMQRACAAALIKRGKSIIHNPGYSNDDKASLKVVEDLGAVVNHNEDGSISIDSTDTYDRENLEINLEKVV